MSHRRRPGAARWGAAAMLTVGATVLLGCGGKPSPSGPTDVGGPGPGTGGALPLGTLRMTTATDPSCPPNSVCHGIAVACPGVT